MAIKSVRWIRRMASEHAMIEPFHDAQVRQGVISYGVSSYGYDMRVADEFKIFTNVHSMVVDPKDFDARSLVEYQGEVCIVPPNSFALARSVEYFRIASIRRTRPTSSRPCAGPWPAARPGSWQGW